MFRNTRTRWAALTSGALVAGGLVVAPAVAGLGAASAAPVALSYTCAATTPFGPLSLPGTVTLDVAPPASVPPSADAPVGVTAKLDFGTANLGPAVKELAGTFDIPLTVAGDTEILTTPSQTAPVSALVYESAGSVDFTAPDAAGDAPITVGTIVGNFSAMGMAIPGTCTPAAGQDLTVGELVVTEGEPASELGYTCVVTGGPAPLDLDTTVTVDLSNPTTVPGGDALVSDIDIVVDMGTVMLGPVSKAEGELDLDMLVGDVASTVSVPVEPVAMTPSTPGPMVLVGAGQVELATPPDAGPADIEIGDIVADLMVTVFGSAMPNSIPCTPDAGQDQTIGSVDVEQAAPIAVPVSGKVAVTGTPKVGKTLKAAPGVASGAAVTYQWLANGKAIKNAAGKSLKLTKALKGKKVAVRATYTKDGYLDTVQTSKSVKVKK